MAAHGSPDLFDLRPAQRRLLLGGAKAVISVRAFDLLAALVERRDRLMPKAELIELVWPGLVVEENNLPVQISALHALRKLLGVGAIATVPGRSYRFTTAVDAPASGPDTALAPAEALPPPARSRSNLPLYRDPLIGRDAAVLATGGSLRQHRLVTVVGGGGLSKSRLAGEVGRREVNGFADRVWWVGLGALSRGDRIAQRVA